MSSPFDGMGAALMASLGAEVTHFPAAGGQFPRRWQIRTYPDESFPGEDRPVLDAVAELKLPRTDLDLVTWGDNGEEVEDPYFGGAGPSRTGCTRCGACMIGCRHNAKNR